jgi:hypothetical protein
MLEKECLDRARCLPGQVKDMLSDPIVRAVMEADRVDAGELEALLCSVARRLQVNTNTR